MNDRRKIAMKYFDSSREFMDTTVKGNIEKYRKGNATVTVIDRSGAPIDGAQVHAKQIDHEFKFGANIFMLDGFENGEKNTAYRNIFKRAFNLATLPFYWDAVEPEEGKMRYAENSPRLFRRPPVDLCLKYCCENGIEPKMHCLNYDYIRPDWIRNADVATHKRALENRFRDLSERYSAIIPSWEVINEVFRWYFLEPRLSKFYYEDDFAEWSFATAEKYFHNNKLIINDNCAFDRYFGNRSPYYMLIEKLLADPATHLDSIGMQYHCFFRRDEEERNALTYYNPEYIYKVLDTYARFGKKLQITEMTIPAFSDSEDDESIQAELLENIYTLLFSHPAMEAVIYWNLVDGYAYGATLGDMTAGENYYRGGLLNFDLSYKKSMKAICNLFGKKWRTNIRCVSDGDGRAHFRGFYGHYEIVAEKNGKIQTADVNLSNECENEFKIVLQ